MKNILIIAAVIVGFISCSEVAIEEPAIEKEELASNEVLFEEIQSIYNELTNPDETVNKIKAMELLDKSKVYMNRFDKDDDHRWLVMDYGQSAARGAEQFRESDVILKRMITEYPDHPEKVGLMGLRAFQLEYQIKDLAAAERVYRDIIEEFPDDELAESAKGSILMLQAGADFEDGELPDFFEKPVQ